MRYQQSDPDVRLMMRVRDDDAGAFEELVRRYQGRLVRLFHHIGPSREVAEDLTQEVFLRIYRSRANYEPGTRRGLTGGGRRLSRPTRGGVVTIRRGTC
jgi:RNA polymerase sigma-70 factor (ECF subfamily)